MPDAGSAARRVFELARVFALFAVGVAVALEYGRRGFMPLDQSICFDGGWRVLSGQVPLRDYTAPNGFTVHALQAAFFAVCGVTWFAYVLHAALINGLFAALVDRVLVVLGLERWASTALAACSAFVFYPPFGVPYMDQHAFFFSLAAFALALVGVKSASERTRHWSWLAVAPCLALAFGAKQIPSAFFVPAVLVVASCSRERGKALWRLAVSSLAVVAIVFAAGAALGVDWQLVDTYFRRLPSEEGARRFAFVPSVSAFLQRFADTLAGWHVRSAWMALCIATLCALASVVVGLRARRSEWRLPLGAALAALFLMLASLSYVALTSNQPEIGVALVFASSGAALASLHGLAAFASTRFAHARWLARGFALVFVGLAVDDTHRFTREIVATRSVNDLTFDAAQADASAALLPPELAYLRWSVHPRLPYSAADLRDVANYLRGRSRDFWLLGDSAVLYGIAGVRSSSPSLWFHPGLTLPMPHDPEFARYEATLLARFESGAVRTVVLEGEHTWIGYPLNPGEKPVKAGYLTLATFPRVQAFVDAHRSNEVAFGGFRAIELDR